MRVLISLPIYERAWILPEWFAAIKNQDFPLRKIGFQFEAAPDDPETHDALMRFHSDHPEVWHFDIHINSNEVHKTHPEGQRTWRRDRYTVMANFRNNLLRRARCLEPDRFFSLDSDIILEDPTTITTLIQLTATLDAVSPLMYMAPDTLDFPNVMTWASNTGKAYRAEYPLGSLFQADVIMAAVMMSKHTYETVNYDYHPQGEDLGWSLGCKAHNIELYCASNIYASHIMSRAALANYKKMGDSRKLLLAQRLIESTAS